MKIELIPNKFFGEICGEYDLSAILDGAGYLKIFPLRAELKYEVHGDRVEISGKITVKFEAVCDSCGGAADIEYLSVIDGVFTKGGGNDDYYSYEGRVIDLTQMLTDAVFAEYPSRVLCSEACKGYCFGCGKNLNDGECGCSRRSANSKT